MPAETVALTAAREVAIAAVVDSIVYATGKER